MDKRQKLRLAQFIYRVLRPTRRHMARRFPHLAASRHEGCWEIRWKGRKIVTSNAWSGLDRIDDAFVVGAGPSMNRQDLSRLSSKPCLLLNGAVKLAHTGVVDHPLAVVVEDARHMHTNARAFAELPGTVPFVLSLDAIHGLVYFGGAQALEGRPLYVLDNLEKPHGRARQLLSTCADLPFARVAHGVGFSTDLERGFFVCGTVMYAGIQAAYQLGARNLYLVGFDMSDLPRFYDDVTGGAWTGLEKGLARVVNAVDLAQQVFRGRQGTIYNCSPVSNIPRSILPHSSILQSEEEGAER